jgi:hypothetical protein
MTSIIKKHAPDPLHWSLYQQRVEEAHIAGVPYVERQYWYENLETGQQYYDLFGCVGWPTEVTDKNDMRPGYIAIVGVVKDQRPAEEAVFQLLVEAEDKDIPTLLIKMHGLRNIYGFGLHPTLLTPWVGDPTKFVTTIAMFNEKLRKRDGHDRNSTIIAPPFDFLVPDIFEIYGRAFYSTVASKERLRFYYGQNEILLNRQKSFRVGDPAIMAIGGLVHTLINSVPWMDQVGENMFTVQEGV